MGKNYYQTLGVSANASYQEIAKQFRVLAITYHPLKNTENMAQANYKFCEICEAFEVLSTPQLREAYDRYGEETLKNGYLSKSQLAIQIIQASIDCCTVLCLCKRGIGFILVRLRRSH